jgi:methylamine utilization protein MauE
MSAVSFGCQCVLLLVFAVSVVSKVRDRASFLAFRAATRALLPPAAAAAARPVAVTVVVVEVSAVVTLAVPATGPVGLLLSAGLLAAFTAAIGAALRRGTTAACRCFGASTTPLGARHLVRNGVLIVLAGVPLLTGAQPGGDPVALALAAGVAVVVALLVISFDVLVDLFAGIPEPTSGKGVRP